MSIKNIETLINYHYYYESNILTIIIIVVGFRCVFVVISGDSSRDLVNELIHHSFISEVRLKTSYCVYCIRKPPQYVHHLKAYQCPFLHVT